MEHKGHSLASRPILYIAMVMLCEFHSYVQTEYSVLSVLPPFSLSKVELVNLKHPTAKFLLESLQTVTDHKWSRP